MNSQRYPPGPPQRVFGLLNYLRMRRDPLGFALDVSRNHGDYSYMRFGWVRLYLVHRRELIREVLVSKIGSFCKLGRHVRAIAKIEGDGLVVSDGESWARHRPLVQGSFHARHFRQYSATIVDFTRRRIDRWRNGVVFDLAEEMNELALEIIAKIVFDEDMSGESTSLRDAVHVFRTYMQRDMQDPIVLPGWLPLPGKVRQRRAVAVVDDMIWGKIRQRRATGELRNDMLGQMLAAASLQSADAPISDAEIRDEAATLFVAGHDTTSAALAWFWMLLALHPAVEARAIAEVDAVCGSRPIEYDDLPNLTYLETVVKESLRMYPASGLIFGREAIEDVELGGYLVKRGSWLMISPFVVHRDPRNFPDPEVFDPDRFSADRIGQIPPYSFIPFGAGPRVCIGNTLSTMQMVLMAAVILQKFTLSIRQGLPELEMEVVLRPKGGLRMRIDERRFAGRAQVLPDVTAGASGA